MHFIASIQVHSAVELKDPTLLCSRRSYVGPGISILWKSVQNKPNYQFKKYFGMNNDQLHENKSKKFFF